MPDPETIAIQVYLDDGRVFEYDIAADPAKAREHITAIGTRGYQHNNGTGSMEFYPAHRILKVKASGAIPTTYPDRVRGY